MKVIAIAVKLASKFFKKMDNHIDDDSFPKEVPAFARNLFTEQLPMIIIAVKGKSGINELKQPGEQKKVDGDTPHCKKQQLKATQKDASNCSFKMGLFHLKKGIPANLALPEKGTLKNGICLDFCCQDRKCAKPN